MTQASLAESIVGALQAISFPHEVAVLPGIAYDEDERDDVAVYVQLADTDSRVEVEDRLIDLLTGVRASDGHFSYCMFFCAAGEIDLLLPRAQARHLPSTDEDDGSTSDLSGGEDDDNENGYEAQMRLAAIIPDQSDRP